MITQTLFTVGLFLLVLICIPWFVKRWQRQMNGPVVQGMADAKVISAIAVGPHQRVVTVEIGPENKRVWLTLGVTQQSVNCLHTMELSGIAPKMESERQ